MKIACLFFSILLPFVASGKLKNTRDGHATGNPGGVICINGKCQTLMEAGLRVSPEYDGVWLPNEDHYQYVRDRIDQSLALIDSVKNKVFSLTFGRADHFRRVDVIDETKLEAMKNLYFETAKQSGYVIDPATFQVVAFSSDNTIQPAITYLLPAFFELTKSQQAILLIHEGLYRGRPSSELKDVLQLESSMQEISKRNESYRVVCIPGRTFFKTCIDQQIIAHRLKLVPRDVMIGSIFGMLINGYNVDTTKTDVYASEFGDFEILENGKGVFKIDHDKLLTFGKVEPRLPYMFSKVETIALNRDVSADARSPRGGYFFRHDWTSSKPAEILSCRGGTYETQWPCEVYHMVDAETIPLVLPN